MTDRYRKIRDALVMGPTPGPWQLSIETPTIIKQDLSSIGLSRGGVLIGSACGHESSGLYPTREQAIANARLIAACDPDTIRELLAERDQLAAALAQQPAGRVHDLAARLVDELDGLVGESDGVSGLHLNGDVATWDELLPGGRFERLSSLDELRAALAALSEQPEARGVVDGCHCATCTCNPGMTPAIRFDTSPAAQEGAIRDHLIALGWTPPGAQQPAPVVPECGYAGCTLWRGSLRITVVEPKSLERRVDPDQAFCDMAQRALDSLAAAWDAGISAAQQQGGRAAQADGCHCATCTCKPGMTPAVRFDTSPVEREGAVRDHLIRMGWTPPQETV